MLMLKRAKEPHIGQYIAAGGKLEPFEEPNACIIREIWEETGIKLKRPKLAGILTETSPVKFNWTVYFYVAETNTINTKPCEEGELEWIDPKMMLSKNIPECDKFITKAILKNKFFVFNAIYDANINLVKMTDELTGKIVFNKK